MEGVDLSRAHDTAQAGSPCDDPIQAFLPGQVVNHISLGFISHLGAQPSAGETDQIDIQLFGGIDQSRPQSPAGACVKAGKQETE